MLAMMRTNNHDGEGVVSVGDFLNAEVNKVAVQSLCLLVTFSLVKPRRSLSCLIAFNFNTSDIMYAQISRYVPDTWDRQQMHQDLGAVAEIDVESTSKEYRDIKNELETVILYNDYSPKTQLVRLVRVQSIHDFGQVLLREQALAVEDQGSKYYRVSKMSVLYDIAIKFLCFVVR